VNGASAPKYFVAVGRSSISPRRPISSCVPAAFEPSDTGIRGRDRHALFDRKGKKTTLTEAGSISSRGGKASGRNRSSLQTAKAISEKARGLNVGCVNFFLNSGSLLPRSSQGKRTVATIEILIMSTESPRKGLRSGAIEVGFVRSWIRDEGLVFEPVAEEPSRSCVQGLPNRRQPCRLHLGSGKQAFYCDVA